jgi:hypothetical protein
VRYYPDLPHRQLKAGLPKMSNNGPLTGRRNAGLIAFCGMLNHNFKEAREVKAKETGRKKLCAPVRCRAKLAAC